MLLLASNCYPSRKGSTGHPGAPDVAGEDHLTATRQITFMWLLLYWPLEKQTGSAGLQSLEMRGRADANGLATQLKLHYNKHQTAKV